MGLSEPPAGCVFDVYIQEPKDSEPNIDQEEAVDAPADGDPLNEQLATIKLIGEGWRLRFKGAPTLQPNTPVLGRHLPIPSTLAQGSGEPSGRIEDSTKWQGHCQGIARQRRTSRFEMVAGLWCQFDLPVPLVLAEAEGGLRDRQMTRR